MNHSVLFFVEDAGAGNFIGPLPTALAERRISAVVLADEPARSLLLARGVDASAPPLREAKALLDSCRPRTLVVGTSVNPKTLGLQLVESARSRGIESVGFVDMGVDAELQFSAGRDRPLACAPDWLVVCDSSAGQRFEHLGFPTDRIVIGGHPNHDRVREAARQFAAATATARRRLFTSSKGRPIVLFIAEHVDGCAYDRMHRGPRYTLQGRGVTDARTNIVLEELLDALRTIHPRPYFVLRLHPRNARDEFAAYASEIDFLSHDDDLLRVLWEADLVVGMTSMAMLEGVILGRPTLAVVPRPEERDWTLNTARGWTRTVWTREALVDSLKSFVEHGAEQSGLAAPRELDIPHNATSRVADFLCETVHHADSVQSTDFFTEKA